MFKWLYYWNLGRKQKKRMARILEEARKLPPYTPCTEEVLAFIDDMNAKGCMINTSHCMEQVKRQKGDVNLEIDRA